MRRMKKLKDTVENSWEVMGEDKATESGKSASAVDLLRSG